MEKTFRALRVYEEDNNRFTRKIEERKISDLPVGDVLVNVKYAAKPWFVSARTNF